MTGFAVDLELVTELVERMTACGRRFEQVQQDVDARARRVHATWRGVAPWTRAIPASARPPSVSAPGKSPLPNGL